MGNSKRNKQTLRIRGLAVLLIACAWLLPTSVGIAAPGSSQMKISVTVSDAVGVNIGRSALDMVSGSRSGQVITKFVTQTLMSQLPGGLLLKDVSDPGVIANGVPFGHGGNSGLGGVVLGSEDPEPDHLESEIIVTVINL